VGRFKANAFGLHDMLGNVWEWTDDYYSGSYEGAPSDGSDWRAGDVDTRVIRGGGWNNNPWKVRSANRNRNNANNRNNNTGFRVSSTPPCQSSVGQGPRGCAEGAFRVRHEEREAMRRIATPIVGARLGSVNGAAGTDLEHAHTGLGFSTSRMQIPAPPLAD
jgi:hypothetical protein